MMTLRFQRYLFLVGAFLCFLGTLLPWVCYTGENGRICADGYSLALFSDGDFALQNNGAAVVLVLTAFLIWMALGRDGFDGDNLQTALAGGAILLLVTLYYLSSAWRGLYQPLAAETESNLGGGLPILLLGVVLMFTMVLLAYLPRRSDRRAVAAVD